MEQQRYMCFTWQIAHEFATECVLSSVVSASLAGKALVQERALPMALTVKTNGEHDIASSSLLRFLPLLSKLN